MTRTDNMLRIAVTRGPTDPLVCPLLTAVQIIGVAPPAKEGGKPAVTSYATPVACMGSSCAWWDATKNGCAQGPALASPRPVEQRWCGCGSLAVWDKATDANTRCARCGRRRRP